jgi:hypothetical protein
MTAVSLSWRNVEAIPLIHGRLPFAIAVREAMLARRHAVVAVELPPSLRAATEEALESLPRIEVVVYREDDGFVSDAEDRRAWYLPIDPCDGVIEALRIARGERIRVEYVDAEIEQFEGRTLHLPDSYSILGMGAARYYDVVRPYLRQTHPPKQEDLLREAHMATRLREISAQVGNRGEILFLCGMAHWERILRHLERGTGERHAGEGPAAEWIEHTPVQHESLFHVLGETPFATFAYDQHRSGIEPYPHDQIYAVKELLLEARLHFEATFPESQERPTPSALRVMMDYTRKLTLHAKRLAPDLFDLVRAARGTVGNDFALCVLEVARSYPPNYPPPGSRSDDEDRVDTWSPEGFDPGDRDEGRDAFLEMTRKRGRVRGEVADLISRVPGEARELKALRLEARPPKLRRNAWRTAWNPFTSCSHVPEDVVIENFRSYISSRTLSMAGLDLVRTEEFTSSLKDGLALRETLRDLVRGKIHVKEEPRVPGKVGAVVMIFEEDDDGTRYPWRSTWMAEHEEESTLAFYATNFFEDMVGPGIGRARYGGCMMIFPPIPIPDVWDDLRFEKARRPSERLLLAALAHSSEMYIAHVSNKPPAAELQRTAARLGKHVVYLPLSGFSSHMLEKLRRFHVLNHRRVRSWASRYIR